MEGVIDYIMETFEECEDGGSRPQTSSAFQKEYALLKKTLNR